MVTKITTRTTGDLDCVMLDAQGYHDVMMILSLLEDFFLTAADSSEAFFYRFQRVPIFHHLFDFLPLTRISISFEQTIRNLF